MTDRPPRLLARWAGLPLRTHFLVAGLAAVALLAISLRIHPHDRPQPGAVLPPAPFPIRLSPDRLTAAEAARETPPVAPEYRREVVRPPPVQNVTPSSFASDERSPSPSRKAAREAERKAAEPRPLPELFRMPEAAAGAPAPAPRTDPTAPVPPSPDGVTGRRGEAAAAGDGRAGPASFAPFGRLVKCILVNSLDSATARSEPIVALVVREVDWNGRIVVPAGTEAFGYARPEAILDGKDTGRLIDSGEWTLVFPASDGDGNGRELAVKARALDRRETALGKDGRVRSWGIDDGTDGLAGRAISTLDNREIKLFAAAAVSGIAQGMAALAQRQQAAAGLAGALGATQPAATAGNAAIGSLGQGTMGVMNELASRIRQEISQRGVYVRVPAGKEFYLFLEQTLDPARAKIGLRLPAH